MGIKVRTAEEIERIKKACQIVAWVRDSLEKEIKPGVTTENLDRIADGLIREKGAVPVFIGYRGYRHATCISINEEIVHGIPGKRALVAGDIVTLDVGSKIDGYCGDTAVTFPVGEITKKAAKLVKTGQAALKSAIKQARAGNHLGDISFAIQRVAEKEGYAVVRDLYGHGIGEELHEDPLIPNFGEPGHGSKLLPGMVLAIEPMLNLGTWKIKTLADGWTVITADKQLSCHCEHTVLITEGDPLVLTAGRSL